MMQLGDWLLLSAAGLVSVPFLVLTVEAIASLLPIRKRRLNSDRPRCAVLIPAHDEQTGIAETVLGVRSQLILGDRIVVVADNCTDSTAETARNTGAEVVERADADRRGKGFALEFGLQHLAADPSPIVVIVDADCQLADGALDQLVRQAATTGRPAQGIYQIGTGQETDPRRRLSAFAVLLKNRIRPLGLDRLGFPCLLTGTGMAFPWDVIQRAHLGTGNIVEDMKLGVDLALNGSAPELCPTAQLFGAAAPDRAAAIQQRTRWEHGHVQTSLTQGPRLVLAGLLRLRPHLTALGLELAVPPLSLLVVAWTLFLAVFTIWWLAGYGSWAPAGALAAAACISGMAVLLAWVRHGRNTLPLSALLIAPIYVLWKLPIYLKLLATREKKWIRTERSSLRSGEPA